jgi:hypothetical protein
MVSQRRKDISKFSPKKEELSIIFWEPFPGDARGKKLAADAQEATFAGCS